MPVNGFSWKNHQRSQNESSLSGFFFESLRLYFNVWPNVNMGLYGKSNCWINEMDFNLRISCWVCVLGGVRCWVHCDAALVGSFFYTRTVKVKLKVGERAPKEEERWFWVFKIGLTRFPWNESEDEDGFPLGQNGNILAIGRFFAPASRQEMACDGLAAEQCITSDRMRQRSLPFFQFIQTKSKIRFRDHAIYCVTLIGRWSQFNDFEGDLEPSTSSIGSSAKIALNPEATNWSDYISFNFCTKIFQKNFQKIFKNFQKFSNNFQKIFKNISKIFQIIFK